MRRPSIIMAALALLVVSCGRGGNGNGETVSQREPVAETFQVPALHARYRNVGRPATDADIRPLDIDVNPSGAGLPAGKGTYEQGARVYAKQCASCHGAKGEGMPPNPKLVLTEPRDFSFGRDPKLVKTVGNYWPYATTLYDYINRAMPFAAPHTLPPDDVYSVVAFLLAENGIIDKSATMDATSLPKVKMPGQGHFVRDDRTGGRTFR